MSDEEDEMVEEIDEEAEHEVEVEEAPNSEEEEEEEEEEDDDTNGYYRPQEEKPKPRPPPRPRDDEEEGGKEMSEAEKALLAQRKKHEAEEAEKLQEYTEQRAKAREKEEEELRMLKEKQEKRKQEREEEERLMAERFKIEEERRKADEEARKKKAEADKARKDEEKKKKRAMMAGAGIQTTEDSAKKNFEIRKKGENTDQFGNVSKSKSEQMTKEQHEEAKKKFLSELKPLNVGGMNVDGLKAKVKELHQRICRLEAARYDLEKRQEAQDYDLKELAERQKQAARNKALKKGLDPEEAATSLHPPKILTASKYDRQIDRRSYGDKKDLFQNPKKPKEKKVFHGSSRPPTEWGRKENDELEQIRKNLEPPKYVELVKVEGAKPPMTPVPVVMPEPEAGE